MSPTTQGLIVFVVTLLMLVSGIPVAFGLGAIAIIFLVLFQGFDALHVVAETFWSGLDEFTVVAIPMFVMMGAAIGSSPAGKDLYEALDRWLYRLPGGLVISNIGACANGSFPIASSAASAVSSARAIRTGGSASANLGSPATDASPSTSAASRRPARAETVTPEAFTAGREAPGSG